MPIEITPAVIQTIEALAERFSFWWGDAWRDETLRTYVCSKEIAPRLINDAIGETVRKATIKGGSLGRLIVQWSHILPKTRTCNEDFGPNKHIRNCLVGHQVHAALAKSALVLVNKDCKGIQRHYSKSLHAKQCQPGSTLGWRKHHERWSWML